MGPLTDTAVNPTDEAATGLADRVRANAGPLVAFCLFALFALNFNAYRVFGDGAIPFDFTRYLFGEDVHPISYQFGLALLDAPFYGIGKLISAAGLAEIQGAPVGAAMISFAANAFVVGAAGAALVLLRGLRLPGAGFALAAAVFGMPLFYYGTFSPSYTHASDALLLTTAAMLVFWYFRGGSLPALVLAGCVLGLATTVRYFNGAEAAAFVGSLMVLGHRRHALVAGASTVATAGLLFLIPVGLGVPTLVPGYTPEAALRFTPQASLEMLFSNHRGLLVWSPVALLGFIGFARVFRTRVANRPFLGTLVAMGAALLVAYSFIPFWDGGWSFSQRYLTGLFPIVVIGLAGLFEWRRIPTVALASLAALWSVYLGLNHVFGALQSDGAVQIAAMLGDGRRSAGDFFHLIVVYSKLRYL
ncbi:MAG TPA: hypothetical protein VFM96_01080 [Gaiellaceae bacterium]|nr:hypothetical protein [Gaiellaceae bacterium]